MKCDECIHNPVCKAAYSSDSDSCVICLPISRFETLEHKLEWLLSYITDGKYSKSSYSIEEMQTFVDDALKDAIDVSTTQKEVVIEAYQNDILKLQNENTDLKDTIVKIVKMVMERMETK